MTEFVEKVQIVGADGTPLTVNADGSIDVTGGGGGGGTVDTVVAGTNITVDATDPANPIVAAPSVVANSLFDANTILKADSDNTPIALALGANTFPGRSSAGSIAAKAITDFGFSLLDDADAATSRATLGIAFEKIGGSVLGADAASFDFTSIPGTYSTLILVGQTRSTTAATSQGVLLRLNNDSGGNYDSQTIVGSSTSPTAGEAFGQTSFGLTTVAAASAAAGLAGLFFVVIPAYAGTAFNKDMFSVGYRKIGTTSGNLQVSVRGASWRSSSTITRVTILPTADNFLAGSSCFLYGLGA